MISVLPRIRRLLVLSGIPLAQVAGQSEARAVEVPAFRSVQLRHGGRVVIRYGPTQRVSFLKGSDAYTELTVSSGGELIIDKCPGTCARGHELEIEIVTPTLERVTVAQGGTLQSRDSFPGQADIRATVDNGGTIDVRSISAETVNASVVSGGRIFVKPLTRMAASVIDGGNITYWGSARVAKSIQGGGVITRGEPSETDQPLSELGAMGPIPPTPPTPPSKKRRLLLL